MPTGEPRYLGEATKCVDEPLLQFAANEARVEFKRRRSVLNIQSEKWAELDAQEERENAILNKYKIRAAKKKEVVSTDEPGRMSAMKAAHNIRKAIRGLAYIDKEHYKKKIRRHDAPFLIKDAIQLYKTLQLPNSETIGYRYPHQVSGGQLQRIMTAMAISPRPELIIFDEPTTALDVTTQVEVLAAIRDIVDEFNTAAIYITHDLAVVAQMADRIKVLRYGEEVEEAETRNMLSNPKEKYTKSLWSVRSLTKPEEKSLDAILSLENVNASYGKSKVLFNVSVKIPKGKTIAIVGESGSGKTTLAKVITGLLPQTNGNINYNGKTLPSRLEKRTKEQLRKIQMIFQMPDTAINPRQTVEEIIGRPVEFYHGLKKNERKSRVIELLKMIELDENYLYRFPQELSGGQKQRICIARALAANPELIICDEVTSALDQIVQEEILKLLQKLQKELGVTYIFITHDIATVKAISDEIVVMYQGKVVEQGMKSEILNPPFPDYTNLLLSSVPEMDPNWLSDLLNKRNNLKYKKEINQ